MDITHFSPKLIGILLMTAGIALLLAKALYDIIKKVPQAKREYEFLKKQQLLSDNGAKNKSLIYSINAQDPLKKAPEPAVTPNLRPSSEESPDTGYVTRPL